MSTFISNPLILLGAFFVTLIFLIVRVKNKKRTMTYAIEAGGEKRLEISVKGRWDEIKVWFDGNLAGSISARALSSGQDLQISDGSILRLKLIKKMFQPERLQILRNGQPIPSQVPDSAYQTIINNASNIVYFIGFINTFLGILSLFAKIKILEPFGFGWQNILYGCVFLVLGFFVHRRSIPALILSIIIFTTDSIVGIVLTLLTGSYLLIGSLFLRIPFLMGMMYGINAINPIRRKPGSQIVTILTYFLMTAWICAFCIAIILIINSTMHLVTLVRPPDVASALGPDGA